MTTFTTTPPEPIQTVHLTLSTNLPTWLFIGLLIASIALLLWTMPSGRLEPPGRKILLACRLVALWTGVFILASPSWIQETERIQSDIIPIMLDVSASMSIVEDDGPSRFDTLASVVSALHIEVEKLDPKMHRQVSWFTFSDTVDGGRIDEIGDDITLPSPSGGPSMIGDSISNVLNKLDSNRVAGVVLMSDGRGEMSDVESKLRRLGVGVWVVPIGDINPPPDISLHHIIAPRTAFNEDTIPLHVVLKSGDGFIESGTKVTIHVTDEHNGLEIASIDQLVQENAITSTTITIKPDIPGMARWHVGVWSDDRLIDSKVVEVDIRDRPLRLLYVEGKPRYFYRFAVPLFTRDQSIDVSILLQSADEDAAPVGDQPIRRFPQSQEELEPFDLVVFGDVNPRGFTEGQLDALHTHLINGAGLLWIPGSNTRSDAWVDTPLEPLLPVPPNTKQHIVQGKLSITPEGESLGLSPPVDARLSWAVAVDGYQPQARQLMQLTSRDGSVWPGFLLLPTGSGHTGWLATDDTWRWRQSGNGDPSGSFLLGVIRLLARHVSPEEPMLRVVPQPTVNQPTSILLEGDATAYTEIDTTLEVDVLDTSGVLRQRVQLSRDNGADTSGYVSWRGLWQPESSGTRQLVVTQSDENITHTTTVLPDASEDMRPGVDVSALHALAKHTGGQLITNPHAMDVLNMIPRRSSKATQIHNEGPALTWLLWGVLTLVLTIEWSVRRWNALA